MADPYSSYIADGQTFGRKARVITPGVGDFTNVAKAVVMLAAGDITFIAADDSTTVSFTGLPAGYVLPFQIKRVTACSSSCAAIEG